MIQKNSIISLFFICFLNGCVQNTVLLGPAITGVSTGSVYHAGLSYGANDAIVKITGKTPTENLKNLLPSNKDKADDINKDKADDSENATKFFGMANKINKSSGIKDLANQ
jgi:hypothetical protein